MTKEGDRKCIDVSVLAEAWTERGMPTPNPVACEVSSGYVAVMSGRSRQFRDQFRQTAKYLFGENAKYLDRYQAHVVAGALLQSQQDELSPAMKGALLPAISDAFS